jgi:hypothetical protein
VLCEVYECSAGQQPSCPRLLMLIVLLMNVVRQAGVWLHEACLWP